MNIYFEDHHSAHYRGLSFCRRSPEPQEVRLSRAKLSHSEYEDRIVSPHLSKYFPPPIMPTNHQDFLTALRISLRSTKAHSFMETS